MMSNEHFKENTRVPVMPEEPRAHKYASLEEAIAKTETELHDIFTAYADQPGKKLMHPMFGELDYEQQIHYLYKHAQHHLRQLNFNSKSRRRYLCLGNGNVIEHGHITN